MPALFPHFDPMPLQLTPDRRIAGLLVPLFALRGEDDLGIGDTGVLKQFIDWAAEAGFALVQLLPINETGGDNSPYNAISSIALDPTTLELRPGALPDLVQADMDAALEGADLESLRQGPVDYARVKALKQGLLRRAFARFSRGRSEAGSARRKAFAHFLEGNRAWLEPYTLFRALMDQKGCTECWDRWPEPQRTAAGAAAWAAALPERQKGSFEKQRQYYAYVQWIAYGQWEAVKLYAGRKGVGLMGDIPLGVSYYSADYFARPDLFETGWSGGAPPEPYFKDDLFTQKWGQNWGIPVYSWSAMARENYGWWRQRVSGVRDLFHVFRIDHILGFYRLYSFPWRPERNAEFLPLNQDEARARTGGQLPHFLPRADDTWENCQANEREGEGLLRMVLEAAGETRLVGEDLGTVPEYVRPNLAKLGIAGFKIPIWENDYSTGRLIAGKDYPRLSVATYGTHDHQPLRVLWSDWLKLPPDQRWELHKLADYAGLPGEGRYEPYGDRLREQLLEALYRSNSWIAIVMITDLLGGEERFNVPGTSAASNWSQRLAITVGQLAQDPECAAKARASRESLVRAGRALPNPE